MCEDVLLLFDQDEFLVLYCEMSISLRKRGRKGKSRNPRTESSFRNQEMQPKVSLQIATTKTWFVSDYRSIVRSYNGNSPYLGLYDEEPSGVFTDDNPKKTVAALRRMNAAFNYEQRETDLAVIETGIERGVKTYILMSADIYGEGEGEFNRLTIQVPKMIRSAYREGQVWVIGDGSGVWNHVHVHDLGLLYEVFVARLLEGVVIPHGEQGIFFTENGEHSWKEVANGIATTGFEFGKLKTKEVRTISLAEATAELGWGSEMWTESGFAST